MAVELDVLAEAQFGWVSSIRETDGTRSSFTFNAEDRLFVADANLTVRAEWPVDSLPRHTGNAADPRSGLAMICDYREELRLIDQRGRVLWRHEHPRWTGAIESGCAWFDQVGDPYAVVPDPSYEGCRILRFDPRSGQVKADSFIGAAPVGVAPMHHPDGWVGLYVGEGQDATCAWWVRSRPAPSPEFDLLDSGWVDLVLSDVDASGTRILTMPHEEGAIQVWTFPGLEVVRSVESPHGDDENWGQQAYFVGDLIVTAFGDKYADEYEERLVAIDSEGLIHDIGDNEDRVICPANDGTILMGRGDRIRRCRLILR